MFKVIFFRIGERREREKDSEINRGEGRETDPRLISYFAARKTSLR